MTEKEKIILKHTELAKEYARLNNSSNLLTAQEWEKINLRKTEIMLEIDRLKAIENSWHDVKGADIDERRLKMLTRKEVARLINVSVEQVSMFAEIGMLKPIKTGRNNMFMLDDLYDFQKTYLGKDISSREKAILEYNRVINYE